MLKKMIIAAITGAAMMAIAGGANAATSYRPTASAPPMQMTSKATPKSFKIAGKRRFRHGRHFGHWDRWHYRPHYSCYWLKRKARWTGKRYWWKRYRACRYNNHY